MVIVNKDAIIKRVNTVQISNELKQNLLERYELLIKNYDNLKTYLEKQKDEKGGDLGTTLAAILKSIEHSKKEISDLKEKLNEDDKLFLEEYKKYDQYLKRRYGFLEYLVGQIERIGLKFHNSNNDKKEKELKEAEKIKQEQEIAKKEEQRRQEDLKKQETDKVKDTNTKETQKQEKLKFEKSKEQHSEINKLMKLEYSAEVKDNTETKEQKKLSNTGENTQTGMYGLLGLFMSIFAYFKRKNN